MFAFTLRGANDHVGQMREQQFDASKGFAFCKRQKRGQGDESMRRVEHGLCPEELQQSRKAAAFRALPMDDIERAVPLHIIPDAPKGCCIRSAQAGHYSYGLAANAGMA